MTDSKNHAIQKITERKKINKFPESLEQRGEKFTCLLEVTPSQNDENYRIEIGTPNTQPRNVELITVHLDT